ncbi:fluoride efflux transporter FluC [Paludifilum halophilum]|uniref:Fluoride-specific ion channel FluC n=1 Tax=Paludifilum halophilum TaxID=1642702 RepID=A0A235BC88_9BACL|nr:CrcB family protein [Paludifilum halophilum]OYD09890.1 hypothetical protein CHM34_02630 [Paludifilum halophilum]
MTLSILWVAIGGFLGAVARYAVSRRIPFRKGRLPWGTFTVNGMGSLCLGWIIGSAAPPNFLLFAGTGFMGSFTTFSTLNREAILLKQENEWTPMLLYLGITYGAGIPLAWLGYWAGSTG